MPKEKVLHFQNKHTDIQNLQGKIEEYLKSDGFTVQTSQASDHGVVLQAKKGKFLSELIDADRALTIYISGNPDDLVVRIGIGKWLEHLGIAAVETLLLSDLFLFVDVGEMMWNLEIEGKLASEIATFVG
ncbi:MAG: hypothetical protein EPN30_09170 [Actinomycetota bacterium]|nr:MAG: hypothetical protein EPN30_09170 [Actinomycetota bacterium]